MLWIYHNLQLNGYHLASIAKPSGGVYWICEPSFNCLRGGMPPTWAHPTALTVWHLWMHLWKPSFASNADWICFDIVLFVLQLLLLDGPTHSLEVFYLALSSLLCYYYFVSRRNKLLHGSWCMEVDAWKLMHGSWCMGVDAWKLPTVSFNTIP